MKRRTCANVNGSRQQRRSGLPAGFVPKTRKVRAVDLFCGIGGLTNGLHSAGVAVGAGYDIDPSCRYAYEANNDSAFVQADIRDLRFGDIAPHYANADVSVLAGCAPCQPFSAHTRRSKQSGEDCSLLLEFARLGGRRQAGNCLDRECPWPRPARGICRIHGYAGLARLPHGLRRIVLRGLRRTPN